MRRPAASRGGWTEAFGLRQPGRGGARSRAGGPAGSSGWSDDHRDRYGLVFGLLVGGYLLGAVTEGGWATASRVPLFLVTVLVTLRTSWARRRVVATIVASSFLAGGVVTVLLLADQRRAGLGVLNLWIAALLLVVVLVVVRRVLSHQVVTVTTIFGALSAYLVIGLFFAACYQAFDQFGDGPFLVGAGSGEPGALQYFSFTTLTTLGYGDLTAAEPFGRGLAVMEAFAGQVFLATLLARLVASFRATRRQAGPPGRGTTGVVRVTRRRGRG
ncbi:MULTISPECIES: potassium channel family protein [Actinoalloteichus]|uniref:potassium channel family protein n=1 Tax=Actinoalloteichus TaxID=65496 RepID=UPI00307BDD8C